MYVVNRSLTSSGDNMYSDLAGKPLAALAPDTAVAGTFGTVVQPTVQGTVLPIQNTRVINLSQPTITVPRTSVLPVVAPVPSVQTTLPIMQSRPVVPVVTIPSKVPLVPLRQPQLESEVVEEIVVVEESITTEGHEHHHHKHHHKHKHHDECEVPVCAPKVASCNPCANTVAVCNPCGNTVAYDAWGWSWLGSIILWTIIFVVLFWLIFYSLKPAFVLQTDSNQVDTAKVLLAAVIAALLLVAAILLIKFLINRSRVAY